MLVESLAWTDSPSALKEHIDGLVSFQQAFALTLVLFIVPEIEQDDHFENMGSLFNQATFRLSMTANSNACSSHTTRVIMVPSPEAAVETLVHFADALTPTKRQLKRAFFEDQQKNYSLIQQVANDAICEQAAALSARNALREWARENSCHEQDADIILEVMGSLEVVVENSATGLSIVPVEQRTKNLLQDFFHGDAAFGGEQNAVSPTTDPFGQALPRWTRILQNGQSNPNILFDPSHLPHLSVQLETTEHIPSPLPAGIYPSTL